MTPMPLKNNTHKNEKFSYVAFASYERNHFPFLVALLPVRTGFLLVIRVQSSGFFCSKMALLPIFIRQPMYFLKGLFRLVRLEIFQLELLGSWRTCLNWKYFQESFLQIFHFLPNHKAPPKQLLFILIWDVPTIYLIKPSFFEPVWPYFSFFSQKDELIFQKWS